MANLIDFVLVDNGGTGNVTVKPCGFENGIAQWQSAASRAQAYRVSASLRQSSATIRRYTIKVEVPKTATQIVGGVELPVAAWRSYINIDVSVPVYATGSDTALIQKALIGVFKSGNPIGDAITSNIGFY